MKQRAVRFLEEAIEAYQAAGGSEYMARRLVTYVFQRPAGTLAQELGGVGVTVLALAQAAGISADAEEEREIARVLSKPIEHFAERNEAKNAAGFDATAAPTEERATAEPQCPAFADSPLSQWARYNGTRCTQTGEHLSHRGIASNGMTLEWLSGPLVSTVDAERPDDSGAYDDETLIAIIAETFGHHPDPIIRRDGAWIVAKLREAQERGDAYGDALAAEVERRMALEACDMQASVRAWHRKFGVGIGDSPAIRRPELRAALIEEEARETVEAIRSGDMAEAIDGMCDVLYVIFGTAVEFGIDLAPFFAEVHRTNMLKVGGATRDDGKILKPDGWQRPRIEAMVRRLSGKHALGCDEYHQHAPPPACCADSCWCRLLSAPLIP